eukprot:963548-Pyramimonas_sp.AAC.1
MAITLHKLRKFAPAWRKLRESNKQKVLWGAIWAAMLTGFFAMLRKDNLTAGKRESTSQRAGLRRDVCMMYSSRSLARDGQQWLGFASGIPRPCRTRNACTMCRWWLREGTCAQCGRYGHILLKQPGPGPKDPLFQTPARKKSISGPDSC